SQHVISECRFAWLCTVVDVKRSTRLAFRAAAARQAFKTRHLDTELRFRRQVGTTGGAQADFRAEAWAAAAANTRMAMFGPRANLFMNVALISIGSAAVILLLAIWVVPVMGYNTQEQFAPQQPVPFSHKHHVSGLGLDCRYCHTTVETSSNAGMPPTAVCMTCHSQIWTNAKMLAHDRQSLAQNKPIRWTRVYTLPDYVFFDHSI